MATHSSTLAWKIPWMEEPGRLQSMGSLRVGHDWAASLYFHFSLSCIGEGNGNPLQCSCLENPRDGGAWWAAVYGVAQSRTRLKWQQQQKTGVSWVRDKGLIGSQYRKQHDHIRISALVVFAKSLQMMQWTQVTPLEAVGCIRGQDTRTKSAGLFEQIANHCSKQQIIQPCPPPPVLLQSP